jgi:hypothetical protein
MSEEAEGRGTVRRWQIFGLFAVLVALWILWTQWDNLSGLFEGEPTPAAATEPIAPGAVEGQADSTGTDAPSEAEERWQALLGAPPVWPDDLAEPGECPEIEAQLARVCRELDTQQALGEAKVPGGTCGLIREVAEQLASRPPELDSELKSYGAILANVFHLFRVMGDERIDLLRRVMKENSSIDEPAAMALYRWLASRESCARSGETPITQDALYSYAGFLFETLGGQAYLRRRSPRQEALASLYALLILERSVERKKNPQGLDPRPEIARTRALIEAQPFVFRTGYINLLDAMDERWKKRTAPPG